MYGLRRSVRAWRFVYPLPLLAFACATAWCRATGGGCPEPPCATATDSVRIRVELERTGGVAGTRLYVTVDSDTLAPRQARELRRLIRQARFFDLPPVIGDSTSGPDRFQYRVTVVSAGRRHSVWVMEAAVPPRLGPLLDWLERAARKGRSSDRQRR